MPTRIIGMVINAYRHNDTGANIRAAPFARTERKLASNRKIRMGHASRYEIIYEHRVWKVDYGNILIQVEAY
jgi:hypothetical protein